MIDPLSGDTELRIVIPAYNEALRIGPVVREYCTHFSGLAKVVVVANGSSDDTVQVIQNAQNAFTNLELIEIRRRVGKGCAVRAGFQTGNEPFVGFTDADGSTSAAEFESLYRALRASQGDGAIASRWLRGSRISYGQSFARRFISRSFNLLTRALFGLPFADTQCGSKIFKRTALAQVEQTLEHAGFAFDVELLWSLQRRGCSIAEVPIAWNDSAGSKVKILGTSWSMLASVLRLRLQHTWMWRMGVLSDLAQNGCVPVRTSRKVLFLGDSSEGSHDRFSADLLDAGYQAVHARDELASSWPRTRRFSKNGWSLRFAFFVWYTFVSRREYDAIVEFQQPKPWFIPAFSVKPALLIRTGRTPLRPMYRYLYRRSTRLQLDQDEKLQSLAAAITLADTRMHQAVFVRNDREKTLCYRNPASGQLEQLSLR